MQRPLKELAVGAVRLAAMTQLGPLAGGIFLAGGAIAGKILAKSDFAKAAAEITGEMAARSAHELFGHAVKSFSENHNEDLEKSMIAAARLALSELHREIAADGGENFDAWFKDWDDFLVRTPASQVFSGAGARDRQALEYDDSEIHALWWREMEPDLLRWREAANADFTQLHLASRGSLPEPMRTVLCQRLPAALQRAHEIVLRDEKLTRSWIAFQQHIYRDTLNHLLAIRSQLDRIEDKLDRPAPAEHVWTIPIPTHHFQDRPDLISQIDAALGRRGATALTALHGLGGIGKSQMARRYAQLHKNRYKLGVWIEAESAVSVVTSFAKLAPLFGVPVEQDQQAVMARVINELIAHGPWLVVFDNADSADALRPVVEQLSGDGHVLITSRSEHWGSLAEPVSVTKWNAAESTRFLLERTEQTDRAAAEKLARDLDGLVLALEHAASYILAGDGMKLAEYHKIWRAKLARTPGGHEYQRSVAAAIGLSIDRVRQENNLAYDLLCVFAWLAPDRIPKKELLEDGAAELPEGLRSALADHDQWASVIGTLGRYSLVSREWSEGVVTGYLVHRVVQQVIRERMAADGDVGRWFGIACDLVNRVFPFDSDEPRFWTLCETLLPHARILREHARDQVPPASFGRLLNQAGIYLKMRGLYSEARDFRELSLESALRQYGPDHPEVAVSYSNLAMILSDLGEHQEARKQIELALAALRQLGPDHREVALNRSNLATILSALGDHQEARKQIELALESDLRQLGPDHADVALCRSNLATILSALGEHQEARKQIELALESALRQFGADHPNVATLRSNLANILGDLGEHEEALKQIELALESALRQFGPDHPAVAVRRSNLAIILSALGKHQEARKQIELALESGLRQLGPDHPGVAASRSNFASILRALGEHQEARKQAELALESDLRRFGPDHPNVAIHRSKLAGILRALGEQDR